MLGKLRCRDAVIERGAKYSKRSERRRDRLVLKARGIPRRHGDHRETGERVGGVIGGLEEELDQVADMRRLAKYKLAETVVVVDRQGRLRLNHRNRSAVVR